VLELLDGFGSHVNCYEANLFRSEHKIISLKEEGDSSHINQAYDRLTARSDKDVVRKSLVWLQRDKLENAAHLDQWDLIHAGLATVRRTCDDPTIWQKSFASTNTQPSCREDFELFMKKIEPHLHASDSYELRNIAEVDKYTLLPKFWQSMTSEQKRRAMAIVDDDVWIPLPLVATIPP
jgi:hypothetical protein